MKVIEDLDTTTHASAIAHLHYGAIPANFTGQVLFYTTTSRTFINGYKYQKGKITNSYLSGSAGTNSGNKVQSTGNKVADQSIASEEICYEDYIYVLVNGDDGAWEDNNAQICYTVFNIFGGGGGDGSVSGDTGSGGSGGNPQPPGGCSTPNPNAPPPPSQPALEAVTVVGGHALVVSSLDCPPDPATPPTLTIQQLLQDSLTLNPAFLIDCDSLTLLKIAAYNNYGDMYQQVAKFTPPQNVTNRIDSLNNTLGSMQFTDFSLQNLNNATGPIVNSDFYPIHITSLPPGMTMASLTEFYRLNLNTFTGGLANFYPYVDNHLDDTQRFNSPGSQSVGALVHIQMADNGTVVESDYQSNANGTYYTFTTMTSPLDINHPVSGNREFGIYPDPNNPGSYTFYTMGVDRTSDWFFATVNGIFVTPIVFNGADKLWTQMQSSLINYINQNGGQAGYYAKPNYIARPDYNAVKDYLNGTISLADLKHKIGC